MITAPKSSWLLYKKGTYPQTISKKFKKASRDLADLLQQNLLLEKQNFYLYLTTLIFLKEHPMMNLILLERTSILVDMRENFTVRSFITPLEVQDTKKLTLCLLKSLLDTFLTTRVLLLHYINISELSQL